MLKFSVSMWKRFGIFLTSYKKITDRSMLYLSTLASIAIIGHLGSGATSTVTTYFNSVILWLFSLFGVIFIFRTIRVLINSIQFSRFHVAELIISCYFIFILFSKVSGFELFAAFSASGWLYVGIFSVFVIEASKSSLLFDRFYFNPTLLFVISFLLLISFGTLLLMLPRATVGLPLGLVDALFMATSAVCVTGLTVIDVSAGLSGFGQIVLLVLVQLGGLGIMTFTGFFGYFFSGGFSYKNQLMFTELVAESKLASVINTLLRIILVTLLIEAIGAVLIFNSVEQDDFTGGTGRVFFSVFHAISAYCNAGFSILPDGLHHVSVRFNYQFQLVIAFLFIFGGLGFGVILNAYHFVKRWIVNFYLKVFFKKTFLYKAWVINFNSKIVSYTTFFLLVIGTFGFLILEYNRALAEQTGILGKLTGAFFMGASPRTAGFNSINMEMLSVPAILLIMFLMWVGASPGSTGGGIKTTTFAVSVLNFVSLVKGKDRVEAFGREITADSVRRSSAIVLLSIFTLALTIFGLSITDGSKKLLSLGFESISAFSTVGLSLGITSEMSDGGRIILAICMFIGRVGTLTLFIAFIKKTNLKSYRYPQEKVLY